MKIPSLILSASLLLCLSCNVNREREQLQSLETITKQELATALEERDELLGLVKEVAQGIRQLRELESNLADAGPNANPSGKARMLSDISALKQNILQRKERLDQLEQRLSNSTINNSDLRETVEAIRVQMDAQIELTEQLRRKLTDANKRIGALNRTVDSLSHTVTEVTGQRDTARNENIKLENEMNLCYYAAASKNDLKKCRIIETGFLRKTRLMKGDFDKDCFSMADKRTFLSLTLNAKKIHVLTNHPAESYKTVTENDRTVIHILNPTAFWSLSNYLVVQTD